MEVLYLPMYNTHPIFRLHLRKKKRKQNRGCRFAKQVLKIMFWMHFKKVDAIIFSEISLSAWAIHEMISSSNAFFWWSVNVKSWIPSGIHCIQPFRHSRNTKGYRTEANLEGTRAELELSFIVNTAVTFQSCDVQRCYKQAGFHISPSHHASHANSKYTSIFLLNS